MSLDRFAFPSDSLRHSLLEPARELYSGDGSIADFKRCWLLMSAVLAVFIFTCFVKLLSEQEA